MKGCTLMFNNINYRFSKKGESMVALLVVATMLCNFTGCSNGETPSPTDRNITSVGVSNSVNETGFDIDRVRKSIIIKGQTIEIPMKLNNLPNGWTYKLYDEKDVYLKDNQFLATMFHNGEEMYIAALENYNKSRPEESIIYNLTIYESDCSIDGLMPQLSTKQDVIDKYGEPLSGVGNEHYYYYGIVNGENKTGGRLNDHSIGVRFTEDNLIKSISITYADLSVNY